MSVTPRSAVVALATAGSLLMFAAAPAAALASDGGGTPHHASQHHVKVNHFTAHGTIVSVSGSTAVVMARTVLVQHKGVRHNVSINITVAPKAFKHPHHTKPTTGLVAGNNVELQGTESGDGATEVFTATHVVQHAQIAHVYLGTIKTISGTSITVVKGDQASDDPAEDSDGVKGLTVDVAKATITVDGAAGALAVGQTVVILGEGEHDAVVAAQVYAFTVAPTVESGKVSAIAGAVVTLGKDLPTVTVDLTGVPLVVNGNPSTDLSTVTLGSRLVVLGTTTASVFTPELAFVFNAGDKHPVGHNHNH